MSTATIRADIRLWRRLRPVPRKKITRRLVWLREPKPEKNLTSDGLIWQSHCGRYRVVFSHCRYRSAKIRDVFYSQKFAAGVGGWDILGRHYGKTAAQARCQADFANSKVEI